MAMFIHRISDVLGFFYGTRSLQTGTQILSQFHRTDDDLEVCTTPMLIQLNKEGGRDQLPIFPGDVMAKGWEMLGDTKTRKKTIGQQINNYVQNPKSYRSAFGFFEVFAGTFLLSKTGFPVKLPSFNSWKLRGSPSVWHGNRNKMSEKTPTATSLSLNFRMGTVHEKTPSANIFFEGCIESTWQWPCPVWQEPMEILLNSVRSLVLAGQSHPKCKSQQKSTKDHTILYLKMWWTSLPGMLGRQSCIQPCLTNLLCSCNWMANNEFSGRRIHIPHHPTASVHFSPSWMSFIFWLDDMLV